MADEKMQEYCEPPREAALLAAESTEAQPKEVDIYRDTPLRYAKCIKMCCIVFREWLSSIKHLLMYLVLLNI